MLAGACPQRTMCVGIPSCILVMFSRLESLSRSKVTYQSKVRSMIRSVNLGDKEPKIPFPWGLNLDKEKAA